MISVVKTWPLVTAREFSFWAFSAVVEDFVVGYESC